MTSYWLATLLEDRLPSVDAMISKAEGFGVKVIGDASMALQRVAAARMWSDVQRKIKEKRTRETIAAASRQLERRKGEYPQGLITLGVAQASLGEIDESISALEQAMLQGKQAVRACARFELAKILYENKRNLPRAVDALRETTQEDTNDPAAWFYLGQSIRLLASQDLMNEATEALRTYVEHGAPLGHADEIATFLSSQQGAQRHKGDRARVAIYWHSEGFTRDAASDLQRRLESTSMDVSIVKHVNPAAPDAAFIGALVTAEDAREVLSGLPYQVRYLFPLDYPPRHGGDDEGRLIGIGYISAHQAHEATDSRTIPTPISEEDLKALLDPTLGNTEFQLSLREFLNRNRHSLTR